MELELYKTLPGKKYTRVNIKRRSYHVIAKPLKNLSKTTLSYISCFL